MMRWQAFNARVLVEIRSAIRRKPTRLPMEGDAIGCSGDISRMNAAMPAKPDSTYETQQV